MRRKRMLAWFLTICLILALLPAWSFAAFAAPLPEASGSDAVPAEPEPGGLAATEPEPGREPPADGETLVAVAADSVVTAAPFSGTGEYYFDTDLPGAERLLSVWSYDDAWFFQESETYIHGLAQASACLSAASIGTLSEPASPGVWDGVTYLEQEYVESASANVVGLLRDFGFSNLWVSYPVPGEDSIGYAIGSKNIRTDSGETFALVTVAVRSGGYFDEWASNLRLGSGQIHEGFFLSAGQVLEGLERYLQAMDGSLAPVRKIWLCGFSRGAAVANVAAAMLCDGALSPELTGDGGVYAYCFCTPRCTLAEDRADGRYRCIFNVINPIDFGSKVPPAGWGYGFYGQSLYLPSRATLGGEAYGQMEARLRQACRELLERSGLDIALEDQVIPWNLAQGQWLDDQGTALAQAFRTPEWYEAHVQADAMSLVAKFRGMEGMHSPADTNLKRGTPEILRLTVACNWDVVKLLLSLIMGSGTGMIQDSAGNDVCRFQDLVNGHYQELFLCWMLALDGPEGFVPAQYRQVRFSAHTEGEILDGAGKTVVRFNRGHIETPEDGSPGYKTSDGSLAVLLPESGTYYLKLTATDLRPIFWEEGVYHPETGGTVEVLSSQTEWMYPPCQTVTAVLGDGGVCQIVRAEIAGDGDGAEAQGVRVQVACLPELEGTVLAAAYDAAGRQVDMGVVPLSGPGTVLAPLDTAQAETVKVFVTDPDTAAPLCDCYSFSTAA